MASSIVRYRVFGQMRASVQVVVCLEGRWWRRDFRLAWQLQNASFQPNKRDDDHSMLSADQINSFKDHGHLILPGFVAADTVRQWQDQLDRKSVV